MEQTSRRRILQLAAGTTTALLAGCNTTSNSDTTKPPQTSPGQNTTTGSTQTPAELQSTISDLQKRVAELEGKVYKYEAQLERKRDKIREQKQDINDLETQLNTSESNLETIEASLEERKREVEALEAELERQGAHQYSERVRTTALEVGKTVREAVVAFEFEFDYGPRQTGAGWFIDDHHIITNNHILRPLVNDTASSASAYLLDGTEIPIEVAATAGDRGPDLALATTTASAPSTLTLGSTDTLHDGDPLVQVGHPGFIGNWVIGLGEFLAMKYNGTVTSELPTTAGNSGSPLVTLDGDVVGTHYASGSRTYGTIGEAPDPVDAKIYEQYPYQERTEALAISSETIQDHYHDWS